MGGIHSEVHAHGVALYTGRHRLLGIYILLSTIGVVSLRDSFVGLVVSFLLVDGLGMSSLRMLLLSMMHTQVLRIIVQIVVVVDDDGLVAVDVLDNSEWIKLDLVGDFVLAAD